MVRVLVVLQDGTFPDPRLGPPENPAAGSNRSLPLPTGPVRVLTERIEVHGIPLLIRAVLSETGTKRQVRTLDIQLAAWSLTVLFVGAFGGLVLARHALGPLTRMAEHARRITAERLHDRLSRLADDLLTLARAEAGQSRLKLEPIDLGALVTEAAERLTVLAEERAQVLDTRVDGPVVVSGDRLALRQALLNLVDNAIKYAPEGSRITLRAGRENASAVLEVGDEGPGIAPEHRDRIFERFYRANIGRSREAGGTGLGLSLVKSTAEAHGGSVVHVPGTPRGSTFRIVLPVY